MTPNTLDRRIIFAYTVSRFAMDQRVEATLCRDRKDDIAGHTNGSTTKAKIAAVTAARNAKCNTGISSLFVGYYERKRPRS
jgi:hypothetical protein